MIVAGDRRSGAADQEVEIGASVGLQHVVDVQLGIAAHRLGLRRHPGGAAAGHLGFVDMQVQAAGSDVEGDSVAVPDEAPAGRPLPPPGATCSTTVP